MEIYINSFFVIDEIGIVLRPYIVSKEMQLYLEHNNHLSYVIITAFDSANMEDGEKNNISNSFLENDIKDYKYIKCYGADSIVDYTHREESFLIFDMDKRTASYLCGKYRQDCVLYGEIHDVPRLIEEKGNDIKTKQKL